MKNIYTATEIISWIQETVEKTGLKDVVIGLSGGIDSALSAILATKALGKEHVFVVLMPYGNLNASGVKDSMMVVDFLGLAKEHVFTIDIQSGVEGILNGLRLHPAGQDFAQAKNSSSLSEPEGRIEGFDSVSQLRKGNIMARVRMIYLFDFAKKLNALVCGTENKTEHYLGYYTRFGDEASDIEPIRGLYKTQVWEMARELGVPQEIIDKAPTAGLWEGQTDEGELGFSYKDADKVLALHFYEGLSVQQIVAQGVLEKTVKKVLEKVAQNNFKHKLPYMYEG